MLQLVDVGPRSLSAYRDIAPSAVLDELARCARDLQGARILHVNATSYGGGVSELLRSAVPIMNDLGVVAHWKVIRGDDPFFQVTKKIHNGLQGASASLSDAEQTAYCETARRNAQLLEEEYDFIFLHDPQPCAMLDMHGRGAARWIWRCHIDTSHPNPDVWAFIRPYLEQFDAAVFTLGEFVPPDLPVECVELIPPAIDPLSPKNIHLPDETARQVLEWIGVRLDRPLVTQVSRFDPWKDPLGVIRAYQAAREELPGLQLALVGSMALDDPEGWEVYREIEAVTGSDPAVHVFTNLTGVGNIEVNAFQQLSAVVIQKSIREGFGLVVAEALWKSTPVVAGRAGGIPLQMADGAGGILVDDTEQCASAIVTLMTDPERSREYARLGKARVREHFLLPRLLLNEFQLLRRLGQDRPMIKDQAWWATRDPVCGMAVGDDAGTPQAEAGDATYRFCSESCRGQFLAEPRKYLVR